MLTTAAKKKLRTIRFSLPDWATPLFEPFRRKILYGGRGSGKSWAIAAALIILAHLTPLRIACVREHQKSLRESAKRNLADMIKRLGLSAHYTILDSEIRHRNGSLFFFAGLSTVSEEDIRGWEDVDIVWVEEAHRMSNSSWEILRNTIRKRGSEIWMSFNPKNRYDPAYRHFVARRPRDSFILKVNYMDNPWFPDELETNRQEDLANEPERYPHIWLGEPDDVSDKRKVLPYHLLELCVQAWDAPKPPECLNGLLHAGLDVADTGVDKNAYITRRGPALHRCERWSTTHPGKTARRANHYCLEENVFRLYYDTAGIGAGVRTILIDLDDQGMLHYDVRPIDFGGKVGGGEVVYTRGQTNEQFFFRKKDQLGWGLRLRAEVTQRFLDGDPVDPARALFINPEIPNLEDMLAEFSQPEADENPSAQLTIEKQPKIDGTTDEPPSPDRYDAAILAFAADSQRGLKRAA